MSKKCRAFSESKLGLEQPNNRKAFYAGWDAALRQALETEQEPVAWMYTSQWKSNERFITTYQSELTTYKADKVWPLYTAPPKREWVGLNHFDRTLLRTTHAPLKTIYHDKNNSVCVEMVSDWDVFFDAIEAKLKEKNHG